MHDRSDYKHGWEIERDWEAGKLKEAKEVENTNIKIKSLSFLIARALKNMH